MVTVELTDAQAARLRELLEVQARDLRHEIHHTDDRAFRELLREKEKMLEHVLGQLRARAPQTAATGRG